MSARQASWRRNKALVVRYKLFVGCRDCGYRRSHWALDYHHRPGETKAFGIKGCWKLYGVVRIKAELRKCVVLCRNCHAEHHWETGSSAPDVR